MTEDVVGPARTAEELFDPEKTPDPKFLDKPQQSANPKALREKAVSDKARELQDENDLRAVLTTAEGVRFVARLIAGPCGWNQPYYQPNNSSMCEVAGRRSIAFQLEQWISNTDLELWFSVRRELEKSRPKPETSKKPKSGSAP